MRSYKPKRQFLLRLSRRYDKQREAWKKRCNGNQYKLNQLRKLWWSSWIKSWLALSERKRMTIKHVSIKRRWSISYRERTIDFVEICDQLKMNLDLWTRTWTTPSHTQVWSLQRREQSRKKSALKKFQKNTVEDYKTRVPYMRSNKLSNNIRRRSLKKLLLKNERSPDPIGEKADYFDLRIPSLWRAWIRARNVKLHLDQ